MAFWILYFKFYNFLIKVLKIPFVREEVNLCNQKLEVGYDIGHLSVFRNKKNSVDMKKKAVV